MSEVVNRVDILNPSVAADFERNAALADEVGQLNASSIEALGIDDQDIRNEVQVGLSNKQHEVVAELAEAAIKAPYEQLHAAEKDVARRNEELTSAQKEEKTQYEEAINRDVRKGQSLVPWLEDSLELLGETKKQKFRSTFSPEIVELEQDEAQLKTLWSLVEKPWPIPALIDLSSENGNEVIVLDEFPVEKEDHERREIGEEVRRQYNGRLEDASEYLSLVLGQTPLTVFTLEQIGMAMYPEERQDHLSNKVSALMSNFETNKVSIIGDCLAEQGLVLQRGVRTYHAMGSHERIGSKNVIFRAVSVDEADRQDTNTEIVKGHRRVDGEWAVVLPSVSETDDDSSRPETSEQGASQPQSGSDHQPQEASSPPIQEKGKRILGIAVGRSSKLDANPETKQPAWEAELRHSIGEAIERLEEYGLMEDVEIAAGIVRSLSQSAVLGSKESLRRMSNAGLLGKSFKFEKPSEYHNVKLGQLERVLSALFNTNQALLSGSKGRRKQRRAVEIIKESLDSYNASHKQ